jgi:CheY-like chemotaxis protein
MCKIIKAGLELEDHEVEMAVTGQQALDYFADHNFPEIVITDLKMAPVDGLQVLSAARNLNPAPEGHSDHSKQPLRPCDSVRMTILLNHLKLMNWRFVSQGS